MADIAFPFILFSLTLLIIVVVRNIIVLFLKRKTSKLHPGDGKTFRANHCLTTFNSFYIFFLLLHLGLSFVVYNGCYQNRLTGNAYYFFMGILHFIAGLPTLLTLNQMESFFCLGEEEIEFNLSIENRAKDTVRVKRTEIKSIKKNQRSYLVFLIDGRRISFKKNVLKLLEGHELLMEKLNNWVISREAK